MNVPQEIIELVLNLKAQTYSRGSIVREVKKITKDKELASEYVDAVLAERKSILNKRTSDDKIQEAKSGLLYSGLACVGLLTLGGIITGITYTMAEPSGTYVATTGLFLVGLISGVVAVWRLAQLLFYLAKRGASYQSATPHSQRETDDTRAWKDLE